MHELDREVIETPAGDYTLVWFHDDSAERPYDEGFILATNGAHWNQIDIRHGDIPDEVDAVLRLHSDSYYGHERHSGAALVRYLTLKGHKGVTLVNSEYQAVDASADRNDRVTGIAWAPDDAMGDGTEYVASALNQWHAWADGDMFGWVLNGPDGQEVDGGAGGYYGFWEGGERAYTLSEATSLAKHDAYKRKAAANLVGAGFIGVL